MFFYIKIEQYFITRNITIKFPAYTCSIGVINKENYRYSLKLLYFTHGKEVGNTAFSSCNINATVLNFCKAPYQLYTPVCTNMILRIALRYVYINVVIELHIRL